MADVLFQFIQIRMSVSRDIFAFEIINLAVHCIKLVVLLWIIWLFIEDLLSILICWQEQTNCLTFENVTKGMT